MKMTNYAVRLRGIRQLTTTKELMRDMVAAGVGEQQIGVGAEENGRQHAGDDPLSLLHRRLALTWP